jgi:hypothetical protein
MRIMLRAAIAALSIGSIPPAIADEGGLNPNTFTELPGVVAQAPMENVPSLDTTQRRQALRADTGRGQWLFPPIGKYLDQHAGG